MWGRGIIKGMWVVLKNYFRGPITVQYPEQKLELPERSRWAVVPKFDEEGNPKCTACMNCVRACPDHVLEMYVETGADKKKHIREFAYEIGACMFCGLCVEACPFDALEMGKDYELATTDTECLTVKLLQDVDAAGPKRKSAEGAAERPARPAKPATEAKPESPESAGALNPDARQAPEDAKPAEAPEPAESQSAGDEPKEAADAS